MLLQYAGERTSHGVTRRLLGYLQLLGNGIPSQPYGNHNSPSGRFYLDPQNALPTPKVKPVPVSGMAVYSHVEEEEDPTNYPTAYNMYDPDYGRGQLLEGDDNGPGVPSVREDED